MTHLMNNAVMPNYRADLNKNLSTPQSKPKLQSQSQPQLQLQLQAEPQLQPLPQATTANQETAIKRQGISIIFAQISFFVAEGSPD